MRTKELEPIYSSDYYRMEKLIKSHRFQTRLRELRALWKKWGVPMPEKGFERVNEYYAWREHLLAVYNKNLQSEDVARAMKRVDDDPSFSAMEKYWRQAEVRDELSPPLPWSIIEQLLKESNLDPKNEKYRHFLTVYIFLRQPHLSEAFFSMLWKRNEKTDEMELFLKLEPHTKREHILAFWDKIAAEQKKLPGYRGKNKARKSFERDLHIFDVYQDIKSGVSGKRVSKRERYFGIDALVWQRLREENKKAFECLTLAQVRKSIGRISALNKVTPAKQTP